MTFDTTYLLQQLHSVDRSCLADEDTRVRLLMAAQAFCRRLETPFEWVQRMIWQEPTLNLCLRVADDLQLFKLLDHHASKPKTASQLAKSCGAEPALLGRILRHLAGKGVIDECAGEGDSYQSTELSRTLATPEGSSGIRQVANVTTPVLGHTPEYIREIGYKVPKDVEDGPFQRTVGRPGQTYFEWIQEPQNKPAATNFNLLMKFMTHFRKSWMDVFPPDELIQGQEAQMCRCLSTLEEVSGQTWGIPAEIPNCAR